MLEIGGLLALFVLLGVGSIVAWKRHAGRYRTMQALAAANGLTFSAQDLWNCTRVPFRIFSEADGSYAENVMVGHAPSGGLVRVFDLVTYDEYDDGKDSDLVSALGGTGLSSRPDRRPTRRYRRHSAAMLQLDIVLPHLVIERETTGTRLLGSGGLRDLNFESEAFNRRFTVTCEDERFAHLIIDPQMMDFLLETDGEALFETKGRWLLVVMKPVPPRMALTLVGLCEAFRRRIPNIVHQEYTTLPEATLAADVLPQISGLDRP